MGTLAYALWWLANRPTDTFPYNVIVFCVLLSLDVQTWLRWWMFRRSGR